MPKNLVLRCDGMANEFAQDRTNVVKLFFTLARDPHRQAADYHAGALTQSTRTVTRILGSDRSCRKDTQASDRTEES